MNKREIPLGGKEENIGREKLAAAIQEMKRLIEGLPAVRVLEEYERLSVEERRAFKGEEEAILREGLDNHPDVKLYKVLSML